THTDRARGITVPTDRSDIATDAAGVCQLSDRADGHLSVGARLGGSPLERPLYRRPPRLSRSLASPTTPPPHWDISPSRSVATIASASYTPARAAGTHLMYRAIPPVAHGSSSR